MILHKIHKVFLIVHSVFGMPAGSRFLRFVLESARINFQQEEFRQESFYFYFIYPSIFHLERKQSIFAMDQHSLEKCFQSLVMKG